MKEWGVLWKRMASGGVEENPYCPSCRLPLISFPPGSDNMLVCSKCRFMAFFRPSKARAIYEKLIATLSEQKD